MVKFEKQKNKGAEEPKTENVKEGSCDPSEMAVLQEMMSEFFG